MMRYAGMIAALICSLAAVAAPATAETLDVSTVTCQDLANISSKGSDNDQYGMGAILYWIAGYQGTAEQATVIDFDAMKKDFDNIIDACKEQPKVGVLTISAKYMGENATAQGSEAIDLATITCEKVQNTSKKDQDGLGLILMWIAGYQAAVNTDKVFDSEAFLKSMKEIGEYCGENPNVGLFTAAEKFMTAEQ